MSDTTLKARLRAGATVLSLGVLFGACGDDDVPLQPGSGSDQPSDQNQGDGDSYVPGDGTQGGDGDGTIYNPPPASNDPFCKVEAIVKAKCQSCHGETMIAGAPMPLLTHADYTAQGKVTTDKPVFTLIGERIHDVQRPMPPQGLTPVTDDEKAVIDAWIAAGAPAPTEDCSNPNPGGGDGDGDGDGPQVGTWPPPDCDETFIVRSHSLEDPSKPMTVKAGTETHPQVIWDAPWGDEDVHAVGFRPITDNAKVLHHWILYENTGSLGAPFITGWAPGDVQQQDMPNDVGMYLPKGAKSLRLDMHYYNLAGGNDELDSSGVEICVSRKKRPNTSTVFMGFSNILGLSLPPNKNTDIVGICKIQGNTPINALSVSPHAHGLAYNMKMEVKRAGTGAIEVWHDDAFSFEDQRIYPLESKVLNPGDVVKTTCSYKNTTAKTVTFGENTDDEMCFNFVTYYPMDAFTCDQFGWITDSF